MMGKIDFDWRTAAATAAVAMVVSLASCAVSKSVPLEVTKGAVIQNVTVVNTRDGSLLPGMTIVIDQGKIQKITAMPIRTRGTAQAIDATGKYVVPGFLDMHAHVVAGADMQTTPWPLLIANGITGVREMSGSADLIQRTRKLNADSAAGLVDAPEILEVSGELFRKQAATAPLAIQYVQKQKADGADFFKIISGNRETILAILEEARKQGLNVAGHLDPSVSALESSNAGWRTFEHLGATPGLLLDCTNDETSIRQELLAKLASLPPGRPPPAIILTPLLFTGPLTAPYVQRIFDTYRDSKCQALAQAFVKNGNWQVPTLIRLRTMAFSDDQLYRADPNLIYLDPTSRALWEQLGQQFQTNIPAPVSATFKQFYGLQQKVTRMLKQNGVKMLAGSDFGGIWLIPGFSLHQEFHELAASGFSPLEILQMTTLNGARFLQREATMGTVDEGKNADLVLLDANPIADAANLDKIAAVVLKGKYFSKAALDKLKSDVAAAYAKQPAKKDLLSAIDRTHIH